MMRFILPALLLCASTANAAPPDLKGKTLAETFTELLPAIGKGDNKSQQQWQDICFQLGAPGNEKLRTEACTLMAAKLDDKNPKPARLWLLTQLQRLGNEESVEGIAAILDDKDDEVRDAAVRSLTNNASPKATAKLEAAMRASQGKAKVGLLNALGRRADESVAGALVDELKGPDETAVAAARALGRIPGSTVLKLLAAARANAKGATRTAIDDALLVHADRMTKDKETGNAAAIYSMLNKPEAAKPIRLAALRGTIQTSGDKAGELVLEILTGTDAAASAIAVGQIENLSAPALKTLAANIEKLAVPSRVLVITAIASRGDKSQLPVAVAASTSKDPAVKKAGVLALGRLGDASSVEVLLNLMAEKDATAGIAAESLAALPADGVNEKLLAVLEAEKTPARTISLLTILERRKANMAIPALLKAASNADAGVRTTAFNGLKSLAGPDQLPGMIAAYLKTEKNKDRNQAEQAIVAVAGQIPQPGNRGDQVLAAIKNDDKTTNDLLPLLGRLGGTGAIPLIHESMKSEDPARQEAAVTGLFNWPDTAVNGVLLTFAEGAKNPNHRVRAIQSLIRVNTVLIERTPEERVAALGVMKKAMELATRDEERRAILEGLGNIRHIDTLHYILPYLDQPALAMAACKGIVDLAHSKMLREPNKAEFTKVLDRVIEMTKEKDKGLAERAKGYRNAP